MVIWNSFWSTWFGALYYWLDSPFRDNNIELAKHIHMCARAHTHTCRHINEYQLQLFSVDKEMKVHCKGRTEIHWLPPEKTKKRRKKIEDDCHPWTSKQTIISERHALSVSTESPSSWRSPYFWCTIYLQRGWDPLAPHSYLLVGLGQILDMFPSPYLHCLTLIECLQPVSICEGERRKERENKEEKRIK